MVLEMRRALEQLKKARNRVTANYMMPPMKTYIAGVFWYCRMISRQQTSWKCSIRHS